MAYLFSSSCKISKFQKKIYKKALIPLRCVINWSLGSDFTDPLLGQ